jgi:predicted transcriptional regulator
MKATSTSLLPSKNRRSRIEIISDIVTLAQNGESEFKIREKAQLNSKQAKSYLRELTKIGLIEMKNAEGRRIYITSQTGNQFLRQYIILKKFLT